MLKRPLTLLVACLAVLALGACSDSPRRADGKLKVIVPAYPFQWIAERVQIVLAFARCVAHSSNAQRY